MIKKLVHKCMIVCLLLLTVLGMGTFYTAVPQDVDPSTYLEKIKGLRLESLFPKEESEGTKQLDIELGKFLINFYKTSLVKKYTISTHQQRMFGFALLIEKDAVRKHEAWLATISNFEWLLNILNKSIPQTSDKYKKLSLASCFANMLHVVAWRKTFWKDLGAETIGSTFLQSMCLRSSQASFVYKEKVLSRVPTYTEKVPLNRKDFFAFIEKCMGPKKDTYITKNNFIKQLKDRVNEIFSRVDKDTSSGEDKDIPSANEIVRKIVKFGFLFSYYEAYTTTAFADLDRTEYKEFVEFVFTKILLLQNYIEARRWITFQREAQLRSLLGVIITQFLKYHFNSEIIKTRPTGNIYDALSYLLKKNVLEIQYFEKAATGVGFLILNIFVSFTVAAVGGVFAKSIEGTIDKLSLEVCKAAVNQALSQIPAGLSTIPPIQQGALSKLTSLKADAQAILNVKKDFADKAGLIIEDMGSSPQKPLAQKAVEDFLVRKRSSEELSELHKKKRLTKILLPIHGSRAKTLEERVDELENKVKAFEDIIKTLQES